MNFFRKESDPEADLAEKARAYDLLVTMRADVFSHSDNWCVKRDLVINGMSLEARGKHRRLMTAISQCHAKYQEALKMGAK